MKRTIIMAIFLGILLWSFFGGGLSLTTEQTKGVLGSVFSMKPERDWTNTFMRMGTVLFAMETQPPPVFPETVPVVAEKTEPKLRNQTSFDIDTQALLSQPLPFLPVSKAGVLIVHTHTSEGYAPKERSTNGEENVIAIGEVIADYLTKQGVEVIHDKTVHDTDYNGSYSRSLETVEKHLQQNPSIQIVLDVHRDAAVLEGGQSLRVASEIGGTPTGQIMLVAGTDEGGLEHPNWETNLSFALRIQQAMDTTAPGLPRPLNIRKERFNQHLAPGMLIVEVAASGNSMEEAKAGALLFAKSLWTVLK